MKKLQENARMAMLKTVLTETDESAVKNQQALDDASTAKGHVVEDYKKVIMERIEKLRNINKEIVVTIKNITEAIAKGTKSFNRIRKEELSKQIDARSVSIDSLMSDLEDWKVFAVNRIEAN